MIIFYYSYLHCMIYDFLYPYPYCTILKHCSSACISYRETTKRNILIIIILSISIRGKNLGQRAAALKTLPANVTCQKNFARLFPSGQFKNTRRRQAGLTFSEAVANSSPVSFMLRQTRRVSWALKSRFGISWPFTSTIDTQPARRAGKAA